jgi:hypothetical protein
MRKSTFILALSFLAALVWLGAQRSPHAAENAKPIDTWEYRVESDYSQGNLNQLGKQGWEICGATVDTNHIPIIFLKRNSHQ